MRDFSGLWGMGLSLVLVPGLGVIRAGGWWPRTRAHRGGGGDGCGIWISWFAFEKRVPERGVH